MEGEGEKTERASQTALVLAFPREGRAGCLGPSQESRLGPAVGPSGPLEVLSSSQHALRHPSEWYEKPPRSPRKRLRCRALF